MDGWFFVWRGEVYCFQGRTNYLLDTCGYDDPIAWVWQSLTAVDAERITREREEERRPVHIPGP